jgi:hypothetical protein
MRFQESLSPILLFIATAVLILVAFEVGLKLGRWRVGQPDPEPPLPARMIIGSVLGLLAFVLGFTFSVAAGHFDARNQAVDDEAASIGTAYHRADLLAEPDRTRMIALLREYVGLRLEVTRSTNVDEVVARLRQLQDQLWSQTISAYKNADSQPPPAIMLQALNEVIDVSSERVLKSMQSRIPVGIWLFLYAMTIVAITAAGYHSGLGGNRRHSIAAVAYALAFAAVLVIITDADNPRFGLLQENRQALIELQHRLNSSAPQQ